MYLRLPPVCAPSPLSCRGPSLVILGLEKARTMASLLALVSFLFFSWFGLVSAARRSHWYPPKAATVTTATAMATTDDKSWSRPPTQTLKESYIPSVRL